MAAKEFLPALSFSPESPNLVLEMTLRVVMRENQPRFPLVLPNTPQRVPDALVEPDDPEGLESAWLHEPVFPYPCPGDPYVEEEDERDPDSDDSWANRE